MKATVGVRIAFSISAVALIGGIASHRSFCSAPFPVEDRYLQRILGGEQIGEYKKTNTPTQVCDMGICYDAGGHGFKCLDTMTDEQMVTNGTKFYPKASTTPCTPLSRWTYTGCPDPPGMENPNIGACKNSRKILTDP